MVRTFATLAFIAGVGGFAVYCFQRPTLARGDVLGDSLVKANPTLLHDLACDPEVEIGVDGAEFGCRATLASGTTQELGFKMDREGGIKVFERGPATPPVKKTADPWGD